MGSRVGIRRGADDTMHILVDGEDMGPAATGIAKAGPRACLVSGSGWLGEGLVLTSSVLCSQNVWAVLDLYGPVRSVSIVSSTRLEEPEGTQPPSPSSDTGSEGEEDDEGQEHGLRVRAAGAAGLAGHSLPDCWVSTGPAETQACAVCAPQCGG